MSITTDHPAATPEQQDERDRLRPTEHQRTVAAVLLAAYTHAVAVIVPLALPGKLYGRWTLDQEVEEVPGFFFAVHPGLEGPHPRTRVACCRAASDAARAQLRNRQGSIAYAEIYPDGHWTVAEAY